MDALVLLVLLAALVLLEDVRVLVYFRLKLPALTLAVDADAPELVYFRLKILALILVDAHHLVPSPIPPMLVDAHHLVPFRSPILVDARHLVPVRSPMRVVGVQELEFFPSVAAVDVKAMVQSSTS